MTDPIRIPCVTVRETPHGLKYKQIEDYAEVTPELARQIVALAGLMHLLPTESVDAEPTVEPAARSDRPAAPPADDASAVEALALAWKEYEAGYHTSDGITVDHGKRQWHYACDVHAPGVLRVVAALRAAVNKWHDEHDNEFERAENAEAQIAALRADVERLTRERATWNDSHADHCAARDRLAAELADARVLLRESRDTLTRYVENDEYRMPQDLIPVQHIDIFLARVGEGK